MSQMVDGITTDHLHDDHEQYDSDCSVCREEFDAAYAEHKWMSSAAKDWPERDWYLDAEGWVRVDS